MTEKEAIERLKLQKEWGMPKDTKIAINTAIQALEKQIPKKPTGVIEHHDFQGKIICICGRCPHCQGDVGSENEYCDTCGQRLDWGDFK